MCTFVTKYSCYLCKSRHKHIGYVGHLSQVQSSITLKTKSFKIFNFSMQICEFRSKVTQQFYKYLYLFEKTNSDGIAFEHLKKKAFLTQPERPVKYFPNFSKCLSLIQTAKMFYQYQLQPTSYLIYHMFFLHLLL